jgi:hypothetical protein
MQLVTLHCALHVPFQCLLHTRVNLFILHPLEVKPSAEDSCTMRLHESIAFMLSTPVSYPRLESLSVPLSQRVAPSDQFASSTAKDR